MHNNKIEFIVLVVQDQFYLSRKYQANITKILVFRFYDEHTETNDYILSGWTVLASDK